MGARHPSRSLPLRLLCWLCALLGGVLASYESGLAVVNMQVAVVTGGNRGIGLQLVKELASRKLYEVVMACRDVKQGQQALQELPPDAQRLVKVMSLEVDKFESRQKLVDDLAKTFGRIDLLINNAGIYVDRWTQENFDATMAANTLGPLDLTEQVVNRFVQSAPEARRPELRVVCVSSGMGELSNLSPAYVQAVNAARSLEDLQKIAFDAKDALGRGFQPAYKLSKAALNRGVMLQAMAYGPLGVSVSSVCPGWVRTDMGGASASRSVEEGAASVLATALAENASKVNGGFFRDGRPVRL